MLPTTRTFGLAILAGALLGPGLAAAQAPPNATPQPAPQKKMSGPKKCVHTRTTTGEGAQAGVAAKDPKGRPLSQKLARADGVICPPPHTDPEMTKPAPGGGTMPVTRPPGTGNGGSIEPK